MNLIRFLIEHSRKAVLWSVVSGSIAGLSNAALLAVVVGMLKSEAVSPLWRVGFVGLCVLLAGSRYVSEALLSRLGQDSLYNLRKDLSQQILASALRHLEEIGPARLMATLTDDLPMITGVLGAVPRLFMNMAVVTGCLIYMGSLSVRLLVVVLIFMVIGVLTYQLPMIKANSIFRQARTESDAMLEHFRALTQGTKELKLHRQRRQIYLEEILDGSAQSFRKHNLAALRLYNAAASWGQALVFVVIGLIIMAPSSLRGLNNTTLTGFAIALLYLMTPLEVIMNALPAFGRATVALGRVKHLGLLLGDHGTENVLPADKPCTEWQVLQFNSISYSYRCEGESQNFIVGPVDLTFHSGELVFFTGGNGSGKTTLAKLLTGLYVPDEGEICLDGKPIRDVQDREWYRQHFAAVFSDCYVFDRIMGVDGHTVDERSRAHLEHFKLSHKLQIKDGRFSTSALSQGQRKRLALLTAYLEDRPIYVFDEWAADQDPHFKAFFYLELLPELIAKRKTVFVISHDDHYYKGADRVIKLDEGRITSDTGSAPSSLPSNAAATMGT
jgi:putative ATP-binding cassette transporter